MSRSILIAAGLLLVACGSAPPPAPTPASSIELPPQPELAAAKAFVPPVPTVLTVPRVTPKVWLLPRPGVPLVAVHVVIPYGAASDPAGRGGLAALTAEMMEQGAGRRSALELGRAAERLGAELSVDADHDASSARLVVLAENLEPALGLLADVVGRPRFEDAEFGRTHPLWRSGIESRAFEPRAVAGVAIRAALYGTEHPYGHPVDGTLASVDRIALDDVKSFHATHWRPDRATIVVVGDVTAEALQPLLAKALLQWGAAGDPPPLPVVPGPVREAPRTVLVERPESAQTVLLVARPGPRATTAEHPTIELVNIPLGGSFTSRLNQNLREDKGYTYGARSYVPLGRGPDVSRAGAAVQTKVTGPALKELLGELARIHRDGITDAEIGKARATARAGDVEVYEGIANTADRFARLAGLGLAPDHDARAAATRDRASAAAIRAAIGALPAPDSTIVAVGDRAVVEKALEEAGLPPPLRLDPEGVPVDAP